VSDETPTAPQPPAGPTTTLPDDDTSPHPEAALSPWPPSGGGGSGSSDGGSSDGGGFRRFLMGALAGGVVGALAAGGLFVLTDDNNTVVQSSAKPVVTREAKQLPGNGSNVDVAAIIGEAEPAVVAITVGDGPGTGNGGAGTGFVISPDGFIVTNNHVVEGETRIEAAFTNGDTMSAEIVGRDPSVDLAVLKVNGNDLPSLDLGDSDAAQVGDEVLAIGNALALEGGLSVTEGIISGTNRTIEPDTGAALVGMLQTDAAINPGNSGGPLIDADGKVIGVNTAIDVRGQNIGFAIPISRAKPVIDDLEHGRRPAFLGVSPQTVTPALARELNLDTQTGAYVAEVTDGAPAQEAGIHVGDVILRIGDRDITSDADVFTAVREHRPGQTVRVLVDRNGNQRTFEVKLTARPDVQ
jgi:S1-C subfamily serine protease